MSETKCPKCGSAKALPILYGMPSAEAGKTAQEGKIILGGCSIEIGAPTCSAYFALINKSFDSE